MKLAITFDSDYLVVEASKASAILDALSSGALYSKSGWDSRTAEFAPSDSAKPTVLFITDAQLTAQPEPLVKLAEERDLSNKRWLDEWTKRTAAEKKVAELEARLKSVAAATVEA